MPRLSKIGAASLAAFGWTGKAAVVVTANYLVVAGGGGGSFGGAGAGGYLTGTASLNPTLSYSVTVGAGGAGQDSFGTTGTNGSNSVFNAITSTGGGGGGKATGTLTGNSGGSGGGGGNNGSGGAGTSGQGNAGGNGYTDNASYGLGGGGGGASAVGQSVNSGSSTGGNGGAGSASSISGSSVTYAGGGGGGGHTAGSRAGGTGGAGGGGNGTMTGNASNGTSSLGGGGGGAGSAIGNGGNGGSGVVIISYVGAQQFGGGVVTSSGGNTIHTFTTSGTLSPLSSLTANFLVVAGGGGGGRNASAAGGAGGYRTSAGTSGGGASAESALTLDTNSIYTVTVGAGGAGATSSQGTNGSNSVFRTITSTGGGGGAGFQGSGNSGGSGGGGGGYFTGSPVGGAGTANQGYAGGNGSFDSGGSSANMWGGGGGGAGGVGGNATNSVGGTAGAGVSSSINGSATTRALGGVGGGGATGFDGTPGGANTGTGGGGSGFLNNGADGGSGVVIISYAGSTQLMAGGTVTVAGGNVIHTFTSSGYLTPIVLATNSLRFRSSASAYLNKTFANNGTRTTGTYSTWFKIGKLPSTVTIPLFGCGDTASDSESTAIAFFPDFGTGVAGTLSLVARYNGTTVYKLFTSAVFRDPSAWYHIVVSWDTTLATPSGKIYINGVEQSYGTNTWGTQPQNQNTYFSSSAYPSVIGKGANNADSAKYADCYMAEINFIDGQALTPNSFGTFNGLGVWQPIRYGGSYGTNGFYLPFTNTTSTTTLVADSSPNGNNWTPNNISLTSGSTYDSMTDVPTLTSATTANYAVLNPLSNPNGPIFTLSNGNLNYSCSASPGNGAKMAVISTIALHTGKVYWEILATNTNGGYGVSSELTVSSVYGVANANVYSSTQASTSGITYSGTTFTYTTNDILGFAWDGTALTLGCYKNGSLIGTFSGFSATTVYFPQMQPASASASTTFSANFGQQPFAQTPPTGFVALNTFNLPTPTIGATASSQANKYMNIALYTGTSSSQSITGLGFQPDWTWIKSRSGATDHGLYDAVRGVQKQLESNTTTSETTETTGLTAFGSDGFTVGALAQLNTSSATYVGWNWKANGTGVTNTAGSITSTVSANTTAGFSIVTYTGTGSNATVGHGLGVAPSMVIVKNRGGSYSWLVYHKFMATSSPATWYMSLNSTAAASNGSNVWINDPTSTVFTVSGSFPEVNGSANTYVAYCFTPIAGYSAFGSYTGNGSTDGPFVFTGFRPRFILVKRTDTSGLNWRITDTSRSTYNKTIGMLEPSSSAAEYTDSGNQDFDIVSNGFKIRNDAIGVNASGGTYIYACFAEVPYKFSNAR